MPGYEAAGVPLGAFTAFPKITTRLDYDDNVLASEVDPISDVVLGITPEIEIQSNWSRHAVSLSANSSFTRHDKLKEEDVTQWAVRAQARADVSKSATITGDVAHNRLVESRTSAAYLSEAVEPIRYDVTTGKLTGSIDFARTRVSSALQLARYNFHDASLRNGGVLNQDFRDYRDSSGTLRIDFALSPAMALFTEGSVGKSDYRSQNSADDRDSKRRSLLAGVDMELTNLITGELSAGYIRQDYDDAQFEGYSGAHYRVKVRWFPTQLATVTLSGTQAVSDSGLLNGDSGLLTRDLVLRADYELQRNIIVSARLGYAHAGYEGIDRTDKRYEGGISVNYIMNRAMGVSLRYDRLRQTSSGLDRGVSFTSNRIGAALILQR